MYMGDDADDEILDDTKPSSPKKQKTYNSKNQKVFADNIPSDDDEVDDFIDAETLASLDPLVNLSKLDFAAAQSRLQGERITPFDRTHYTQCIKNPLAGTQGVSAEEMITVQLARPVLSKRKGSKTAKVEEKDMYQ